MLQISFMSFIDLLIAHDVDIVINTKKNPPIVAKEEGTTEKSDTASDSEPPSVLEHEGLQCVHRAECLKLYFSAYWCQLAPDCGQV